MASQEELNREQEINDILNKRVGINEKLLSEQQDISNVILDQVKNLNFTKVEQSSLRSITRDLAKTAQANYSLTLKELGSQKTLNQLAKDRKKTEDNIAKLEQIKVKELTKSPRLQKAIQDSIDFQVKKSKEFVNELDQQIDKSQQVADNLGVKTFGALEDITNAIPGLRKLAGPFQKAAEAARLTALESKNSTKAFAAGAKVLRNQLLIGGALKVLSSVLSINKAQTEFRRLTGEAADEVGLLNDGLLTSVDLIQTQVALTEQFGLNARVAFGTETLQEVGELTKAVGLTAEEAGSFARFSEIAGYNLNSQLDSLTKSVPKAFSQKQILRETANVSNDIALAFGNSAYEIGQSVIAAKQLGLSLQDVNSIADNLLDIESSIAAEFEAEVITGRQLNFERARFFALTNNLAGLTEEIKGNEEIINEFAGATRIEQEAIAKAFGMSRQQMADMVMSSKLINTLSDEQRANAAGISIEQLKQLDIQQSIETSINKLTQALAGPLEGFANLVQLTVRFTDALVVGAGMFTILNNRAKIQAGIQATIGAFQNKNLLKGIADMAISAYSSVAKIPFIGPALGAAAAVAAYSLGKSYFQKGDDIISPGYGKRTLLSPEGAISLNNKDTVIAGTNLGGRDGRNSGEIILSDAQINKIANAVRDGASRATINLDGDRVSSRLQTPGVINQRQYSI